MMKYNYYILSVPSEYWHFMYSDLGDVDYAIVNDNCKDLIGRFYKLWQYHNSKTFNKTVNLPFKSIWNRCYVRNHKAFTDKSKPICFIVNGVWAYRVMELGLGKYIRKQFPGSKIIWYLGDLISKQKPEFPDLHKSQSYPDMEKAKIVFDRIISFDHGDCRRYVLTYYPLIFSTYKGEKKADIQECDVYFCGQAKDRLPLIMRCYSVLKSRGLKLDFFLTGVPASHQIEAEGITYGDWRSYETNLQHVWHCKAQLEIMQSGGEGFTIRTNEVIGLDKKLITNNCKIKEAPFYNKSYISVFSKDDASDIDIDFIEGLKDDGERIDYNYKSKMSPIEFLNFVDSIM